MNYNETKLEYLLLFKELKDIDEQILASSATHSSRYAKDVLCGRFELGEAAIATDSYYSYKYARYVLKGRFELGEAAIATDSWPSFWYARDVMKGLFELGEAAISRDQFSQLDYDILMIEVRNERRRKVRRLNS